MSPTPPPAAREYGLDWLRVFAFAVLIFYHSGMIFVPWDFHIKNGDISTGLASAMVFFNRWRLPLLFFISGCGVWFSLRRRGWGEFAGERLRRLLIPVLFGIFVIVPPQIYFERLHRGQSFNGYGDFYRTVLEFVPYPQGNTSWHHLWFVVYILVYSLIGIPLFAALKSTSGRTLTGHLAVLFDRYPATVYLINIPSLAVAAWLGPRWPVTHALIDDWANFTGSFVTFLWGFIIASQPRILDLIERRRREFLGFGILLTIAFYVLRANRMLTGWTDLLVNGYLGMMWIFALAGYARAHIRSGGPWLRYASEAVYPFYILHQTVTVTAGYYIVQTALPWGAKLATVMAITFFGSWVLVELARRNSVTRLLLGIKAPDYLSGTQMSVSNSVGGTSRGVLRYSSTGGASAGSRPEAGNQVP